MTSAVPVIPLQDDGGVLVAVIVPVTTSDDVLVLDVATLARIDADVRIGDETRRLPVYTDAEGDAYVTWDDAFSAP